MNYLALVQDLARQSGTLAGGVTISSVASLTGRAEKLANWIASAWTDIQNQRRWNWLRSTFSASLIVNTTQYTATSLGLARFGSWMGDTRYYRALTIYDPDTGQSDETELTQIPYEEWREKYDRGTHDANRPIEWAISPARELCFGPKPDQVYTIRGEYWKTPQTLSDNTDEPEAPDHLHKIIVYRAMELMAQADESVLSLQMAQREYQRLFASMANECLPAVSTDAGPLA